MNSTIKTLAIASAMGLSASGVFAAATASDTAANYSASGAWSTTPGNLGSGFGAWNITDNNASPPYAGTYLDQTSYNNSDNVLAGGYAWGAYANGGSGNGFVDFNRPFTTGGGSDSLVGQTFSIGLGSKSGVGGTGSSIGLSIGTAFNLAYIGGGADQFGLSVDGGAASAVPVTAAQLEGGLLVSLTVGGIPGNPVDPYTLAISPFAGGGPLYTTSGTFDAFDFNTSSFTFAVNNTSGDQFFNNPTISAVPEPSSLLFGLAGLASLLAIRRK